MNIRGLFFTFSGLLLCLFQFSLAQEFAPEIKTINADQCRHKNSTFNLGHFRNGILQGDGYWPLDCEIEMGDSMNSIVISFYEHDLNENDELVFKDSEGTELSLTGKRRWNEKKSFIFKGLVAIHYSTNGTFSSDIISSAKFKFVFTKTHDFPCLKNEFECNNRQCIPNQFVCDLHNNCGDGSDEIDCNSRCTDDEFKCSNRKCIPNYKLCDGRNDCGDNSDEQACNIFCELHQYECNNSRCISNLLVCDDRNDCGDWSDETNCYRPCNEKKFRCNNGKCIDSWKLCNGNDDCGDRSDENNCRECYSWEFRCSNRKCVPKSSVCNNRNDCGDNSDENGCNIADGNTLDQKKELMNPWYIAITVCAVLLGIIVVTFFSILIRNRVADKKKKASNQASNFSTNTDFQHVQPPNLIGRIRQSFRLGHQTAPSSIHPPGEIQPPTAASGTQTYQVDSMYPHLQNGVNNTDVQHVQPPNLIGRIRQSFRSKHQSTQSSIQPPNHIEQASVISGPQTYQVPSMYLSKYPPNIAERDNADQRKVTVVELSNPWLITIIVCAAVLAIVIVTFAAIFIRNRMNKKKKPSTTQLSNVPTNTNNQNVQPPNLFGRIRQSFRSGGQSAPSSIQPPGQIQQPHAVSGAQTYQAPSVYPQIQSGVENSDVHQVPPRNFVEGVRQSSSQSAPSSIQPPGPTEPPAVASGEQPYQVPSMYPHLQSGVDNPVFRAEV